MKKAHGGRRRAIFKSEPTTVSSVRRSRKGPQMKAPDPEPGDPKEEDRRKTVSTPRPAFMKVENMGGILLF